MKYEKLVYTIGTLLILLTVLVKILHLPFSMYANLILSLSFITTFAYQSWQVTFLKRRIRELESKQAG